ncbi:hypothetical protein RHGRI_004595 [Rhododendron griersonianum]|uniref:Uncharacterized protein n=1 Tax=Rhododendron griersonianum TaxID=479676 RepID=A0AAV6LBL3_9ERIC|nr:hypothetical protein RHGRI_004595 [Rhododendron griersonianum]
MSTSIVSLSLSLSLSTRWYAGDPNPFLGRLLDFRNPIPPHPLSLPRPFQLCVDQRCLIYSPSIPSSLIDFSRKPRPHLRRPGHPLRHGWGTTLRSDGGECRRFEGAGGGGLRREGVEECRVGGSCEAGVGRGCCEAEECYDE